MADFVGSPGYTAPEVMDGEYYNHLVDSYSFGVILFMMSVGDQPFYGQGSLEDYYLSLQEEVPEFLPGMCPDTINIIEGLLCKTPSGRSIRSHRSSASSIWARWRPAEPTHLSNGSKWLI